MDEPAKVARRSRGCLVALVLALAVVSLSFVPTWSPMGRDDGVFTFVGWTIHQGGVPYRDVWDHKPPAIYAINAAAVALGGRWGTWAAAMAAVTAAGLLAAATLVRCFGPACGWLGAAIHFLLMTNPKLLQDNGNMTEVYALPLQWAELFLLCGTPGFGAVHVAVAGLAAGAALCLKPTTAAIALALSLLLVARRQWRFVLVWVAGISLVPLAAAAWVVSMDVVGEAIDALWIYNRAYAPPDLAAAFADGLRRLLTRHPWGMIAPFALLSYLVPRVKGAPHASIAPVTALAFPFELLLLSAQGRFYGHYYLTLLPVLVVRACLVWSFVAERYGARRNARRSLAAILLAVCTVQWAVHWSKRLPQARNERHWQDNAVAAIARWNPGNGAVLVWGAEIAIDYLGGWRPPSRYGYLYPLFTSSNATQARWDELLGDLERNPPAVIFDVAHRAGWPQYIPGLLDLDEWGPLPLPFTAAQRVNQLLSNYRIAEHTAEGEAIWVRVGAARGAAG